MPVSGPSPSSGHRKPPVCPFYRFACSGRFTSVDSYSGWPFVTDFLCFAQGFRGSDSVPRVGIHMSTDGRVGYFQFFAIVKSAVMDVRVSVFRWTYVFPSQATRQWVAGSLGKSAV